MEVVFLVVIVLFVVVVAKMLQSSTGKPRESTSSRKLPSQYRYNRKDSIMTGAEGAFFRRLTDVAGDRYYIFPQIHLDSVLNHAVKGQDWRGALSTIQRKSVDFVLCDKQTLRPMYAVELDDRTHDSMIRQKRDASVERMFAAAGLPLVRFRNVDSLNDQQIIDQFAAVAQHTRG